MAFEGACVGGVADLQAEGLHFVGQIDGEVAAHGVDIEIVHIGIAEFVVVCQIEVGGGVGREQGGSEQAVEMDVAVIAGDGLRGGHAGGDAAEQGIDEMVATDPLDDIGFTCRDGAGIGEMQTQGTVVVEACQVAVGIGRGHVEFHQGSAGELCRNLLCGHVEGQAQGVPGSVLVECTSLEDDVGEGSRDSGDGGAVVGIILQADGEGADCVRYLVLEGDDHGTMVAQGRDVVGALDVAIGVVLLDAEGLRREVHSVGGLGVDVDDLIDDFVVRVVRGVALVGEVVHGRGGIDAVAVEVHPDIAHGEVAAEPVDEVRDDVLAGVAAIGVADDELGTAVVAVVDGVGQLPPLRLARPGGIGVSGIHVEDKDIDDGPPFELHIIVAIAFLDILVAVGGLCVVPFCPTLVGGRHLAVFPNEVQTVGVNVDFALNQLPVVEVTHTQGVADSAAGVAVERFHQRTVVVEVLAAADEVVALGGEVLADFQCSVSARSVGVQVVGGNLVGQAVHVEGYGGKRAFLEGAAWGDA